MVTRLWFIGETPELRIASSFRLENLQDNPLRLPAENASHPPADAAPIEGSFYGAGASSRLGYSLDIRTRP